MKLSMGTEVREGVTEGVSADSVNEWRDRDRTSDNGV